MHSGQIIPTFNSPLHHEGTDRCTFAARAAAVDAWRVNSLCPLTTAQKYRVGLIMEGEFQIACQLRGRSYRPISRINDPGDPSYRAPTYVTTVQLIEFSYLKRAPEGSLMQGPLRTSYACGQLAKVLHSPKNWGFWTICQLATCDGRGSCIGLALPPYTIITPSVKRQYSVDPVCGIGPLRFPEKVVRMRSRVCGTSFTGESINRRDFMGNSTD
ncbi:hypothetical protein TNCV_292501 [Trichonephila clavipes]|nr:hypothetical protein TNCV_292501 [Trichonephila clavipes]